MPFRFSPRPNRAHDIQWRSWGAEPFAEAVAADKPILLNLTAVWCQYCHEMDETTFSDNNIITLINDQLIPVRVDADQYPHVQDRYIAGGWPTNAFLAPTGEVLWAGTYVTAEQFTEVAGSVLGAWNERRDALKLEIERRRKALETARTRQHGPGLVRREAADDVLAATIEAYDERNGGFGGAPKFPYVDAIELLFVQGARNNTDYLRMAEHSLDGMLAGDLWDREQGGFYRYAATAEWTDPREEKLLIVNAALLRIFALGASVNRRDEWRDTAVKIVEWADRALGRPDGLWAASDAPNDDVLNTSYNAQWIAALACAGGRLRRTDWIMAARAALDTLLETMAAPNGLMFHFRSGSAAPQISFLLADSVDTARASIAVAQVTGNTHYFAEARRLATAIENTFWSETGGFWDRAKGADEVGMLRFRDVPFENNADAARLLNDLHLPTGERRCRALAERVLATLSAQAGRHGVAGAGYALAVDDFFDPPLQIVITGTGAEADALRQTALALPIANRAVWTMPEGGRVGQLNFARQPQPAAYIASSRGMTPPVTEPDKLEEALTALR